MKQQEYNSLVCMLENLARSFKLQQDQNMKLRNENVGTFLQYHYYGCAVGFNTAFQEVKSLIENLEVEIED